MHESRAMDAGHDVSAPMWVVRAMDIIRMSGTPKHHQELKELGLLAPRPELLAPTSKAPYP